MIDPNPSRTDESSRRRHDPANGDTAADERQAIMSDLTSDNVTLVNDELPGRRPELEGSRIAVVDDDPTMRKLLRLWLAEAGYDAVEFDRGATAIEGVDRTTATVCLDLGLGDMPGMEVLCRLRARSPDVPIIVVTARKSVEAVVEAMKAGAYDYLAKPIDALRFGQTVRRAVEHHAMIARMRRLESELGERSLIDTLAAQSAVMREVARAVERVRDVDVNVALLGESGTGKEVVARAIHDGGWTRNGPFVAVNCASIPAAIQESELFGHEKGAFTGAAAMHRGKFEQAAGGTLFLDEIGEMSPATQASLLRVLQERVIVRVGGRAEIPVNARVICATHRDLAAEVRAGRFREDLFFRLVVYPIRLPALRDRPEDLPLLVAELLRRSRIARDRGIRSVSTEALESLSLYRWPGNVRELDNVLQRACLACDGREIGVLHLPSEIRGGSRRMMAVTPPRPRGKSSDASGRTLREIEKSAVLQALEACGGNITAAAKLLGVSRTKLYRDLR
ncbi:Response regulator of zinc sigma-54-dependent two-component system [Minicystis rosea]|nr:Response regulator of zinc sigma-54-dependent two-component system [Minicystis rosea]